MPAPLLLHTLGEARLTTASGAPIAALHKELILLAYLARQAPAPLPREELATLLWGERPEVKARTSLRQALLHLRRTLGEGLRAEGARVALAEGAVELDAAVFEAELGAGRLEAAVALWRGEFMAGSAAANAEPCRDWVDAERARLRRGLLGALQRLASDAEARGEWEAALAWVERWARAAPYDERALRRRQELLARGGPLAEWLGAAEPATPFVLSARAKEAERAVAGSLARELLAELRNAPGLCTSPDAALAEIARLVPALREQFPQLPPPLGTQRALDEALARVLADVAAEVPVVLFVAGLASADARSQRLLLRLARRLPAGVRLHLAGRTATPAAR